MSGKHLSIRIQRRNVSHGSSASSSNTVLSTTLSIYGIEPGVS